MTTMEVIQNERNKQTYVFGENELVYVNGKRTSEIEITKRDSGVFSVATKNRGLFSVCMNVMDCAMFAAGVYYTSHALEGMLFHHAEQTPIGIDTRIEDFPCDYFRENQKEVPLKTLTSGQAVYVVAQRK